MHFTTALRVNTPGCLRLLPLRYTAPLPPAAEATFGGHDLREKNEGHSRKQRCNTLVVHNFQEKKKKKKKHQLAELYGLRVLYLQSGRARRGGSAVCSSTTIALERMGMHMPLTFSHQKY